MVEAEFAAIWKQVEADQASGQSAPEDAGKTPEELRAEYHRIAERRVRVGLVLAEIGLRHNIQVRDEEVARAVNAQARQFPGREREVVQFYQKNPQALAQVRAPLFEEKVVDFILELAKVADRSVTREDVLREDDSAPSPAQAVAQDEKPAKKPAKSAKSKSEPKQD
jgi:trigger factor